jgi:glycosyltransferase involved in cell wall biosynthesis
MGENGRRAVEEKYNWEKEAEKLLALYKELVDSAKGG